MYMCIHTFFFKILKFFLFLPKGPWYMVVYFLVVDPSSCGMWDATSAGPDEQCQVRTQDPNQRTLGCQSRAWELNYSATGPAPVYPFYFKMAFITSLEDESNI